MDETVQPINFGKLIEDLSALLTETKPIESGNFNLNLTDFHFDKEEANDR